MKLSFDKSATRKLELWATSRGQNIDDLDAIRMLAIVMVDAELDKLKPVPTQPEKRAT